MVIVVTRSSAEEMSPRDIKTNFEPFVTVATSVHILSLSLSHYFNPVEALFIHPNIKPTKSKNNQLNAARLEVKISADCC